jgi:hypothetical protein
MAIPADKRPVIFARFLFAHPAAFVLIANRYGLPLSRDASEAMRAGRAYERQVIAGLEG